MSDVFDLRSTPVRLLALAVGILLVGAVGAVVVTLLDDPSPLDRARDMLADEDDFVRATDAGAAFTRVSELLEEAADECEADGEDCDDLFTASAFARVGAVGVLRCGRPEIFAFREGLRSYVAAIDAGEPASPPPAPSC